MDTTTPLSAADWLRVRDRVAETVRGSRPRMEAATSIIVAEALIKAEFIDVEAVRATLTPSLAELPAEAAFDVVFGGDHAEGLQFVEVETVDGLGVALSTWVEDGLFRRLRITPADFAAAARKGVEA